MASVVFLRGVNVGGKKAFRPAVLAKDLAHMGAASIGAAGTFVVRESATQVAIRREIAARLPFEAEIMICSARDLVDLAGENAHGGSKDPRGSKDARVESKDLRRFVSVLAKRPRSVPPMPLRQPDGAAWQVELVSVRGRFVLSWWRRTGHTLLYPNEVVEKRLGVPATTRNWDTILKIHDVLQAK